ncbi:hypothetical protein [Prevotella sp. E13-27]|uniref:hypothetical protein n=1 Tax=Prevotella sp. E13-27 TaxID=2938122 RepID=UPI00200B727C|nr:hypothetical protein [Prevotella sp. E13-27]MCK8623112.1 hypothetical protein [Prevotella sp. E13-27]
MGRKITMTGKNAQYIEHRGANTTPDNDREILMKGDEAVYQEFVTDNLPVKKKEPKKVVQEECYQDKVVDAIHELTDVVKESLKEPKINLHLELVNKKETNIDKNFGPNIEHNGGTLTLPDNNKEQ